MEKGKTISTCEESLHFWLAKSKMSHEKLYLLTNFENGNTRVIFGSANFSYQAFSNNQRELICYTENDKRSYSYFKGGSLITRRKNVAILFRMKKLLKFIGIKIYRIFRLQMCC